MSGEIIYRRFLNNSFDRYCKTTYFRGYLFSRLDLSSLFRGDLISRFSNLPSQLFNFVFFFRTTLPVTQLVLHHYRECRTFYGFSKKMYKMNAQQQNILLRNNFTNDKCFGFKTYYQSDMELIIDKIETSVLELHRKLLF